ncbi:cyclopropane fatty acyl phospholipid synthase [Marinobacter bohaiensis]|uniref:cyclopropane fatty acyl phospholipid synthase n=1 Tax=Marinobacter bohaiensis TaxID=2201898 RepID=UPI001D172BAB|nr:cyclopropane fatty acyl phospholipid synthase [Marinobacter bohaiensis]
MDMKVSQSPFLSESNSTHRLMVDLLAEADIRIGGDRPWDMQLNNTGVPERVFAGGSLGLGESYMDGDWDVPALDEFFYRIMKANLEQRVRPSTVVWQAIKSRFLNRQTLSRSRRVGEQHYDLGNDFYAAMLDGRMTYTCGYWRDAETLDQAQEAKLDLICRKLQLEPGMRILDIGCGWGSFMAYAAEHYGVECVGVTISREQVAWAKARYPHLPLEFRLQDYREVEEQFDRIVSVGMFEHVGHRNYRTFMEVAHRCLKDEGLFLLHTIGKNERKPYSDPWIDRYIFPNGELPSIGQVGDAADNLFVVEDLHNFGRDYDRTLMAWHANFEANWPRFANELGPRFYRMWRYYLQSCAGLFRARDIQLWQWVLSKGGTPDVFPRIS